MKLYIKNKPERHVLLVCSVRQAVSAETIIRKRVLAGVGAHRDLSREQQGKTVRYKFKPKHLGSLVDMFAQAEYSASVERWIERRWQAQYGDVRVPDYIPGLVGEPYEFQRWGAAVCASRDNFFLHDDVGTGKTVQALMALSMRNAFPALVIAPNTVKHVVWAAEAKKWFPGLSVTVVDGRPADRELQLGDASDIKVVNFEALRLHPEIAQMDWRAIVVDEHHRIKNIGAQQTQAFQNLKSPYKLLLSGTPMLNGRLEELWSPLHWAFPEDFPGDMKAAQPDWRFRNRYCTIVRGQIVAYKNVGELRTKLHERSLRRRLDSLPAPTYSVRQIELNAEQKRLYREAKEEMRLWLEDGTAKRILDLRARYTRLKQICFSPELFGGKATSSKVEELKYVVAEITKAGHKALIFSSWEKATRIIDRELARHPRVVVTGKVKPSKRRPLVEAFQDPDGEPQLYIGTIRSNMEGITLTAASYVIFTDLEWVPEYNRQAVGRAQRIGQKKIVNVVELQAHNTVEERIVRMLAEKQEMNAMMTERDYTQPLPRKAIQSILDIL